MITFDKKTLAQWHQDWVKELSVYFYKSGCAGTKIRVETTRISDCNKEIPQDELTIYVKDSEIELIDWGRITQAGNKWLFQNKNINSHCGCGSSFSLKSDNPLQDKIARMKLAMKLKKEWTHRM